MSLIRLPEPAFGSSSRRRDRSSARWGGGTLNEFAHQGGNRRFNLPQGGVGLFPGKVLDGPELNRVDQGRKQAFHYGAMFRLAHCDAPTAGDEIRGFDRLWHAGACRGDVSFSQRGDRKGREEARIRVGMRCETQRMRPQWDAAADCQMIKQFLSKPASIVVASAEKQDIGTWSGRALLLGGWRVVVNPCGGCMDAHVQQTFRKTAAVFNPKQ